MYEALTPITRARSAPVARLRPAHAAALVTLVLTTILLATVPRPLSPDISGQLWIARHLRQGARLYVDISEINPPLWFWMAMPVDGLAALLRIRPEDVLIAAVGGVALASLLGTDGLLAHWPRATRAALLTYAATVFLVMPLRDLGQREQLALFGALPYVALVAARREGRRVSVWLAWAVGAGAAAGFALKHYFVGVPLMLELWLAVGLRRGWRPVRPETLALAVAALGYGAAILVMTPGYLQVSVPELRLAYGDSGALDLTHVVRPAQPAWVLILAGIATQRLATRRPLPPLAVALLVAATGFAAAWLIQHKGWPYQSIATTGLLALALAATLVEGASRRIVRPRPIAAAALVAPLLLSVFPTQWTPGPDSDIAPALADLHAGDAVGILSIEGRTEWPGIVGRGLRFSGRRGSLWMLAAVDARGKQDSRVAAFGRRVVRDTVLDYRCLPPKRIVFFPRAVAGATDASAAPLRYFSQDPHFAALLRHYRRLDGPGGYDAFTLVRPLDPVLAASCPRGL